MKNYKMIINSWWIEWIALVAYTIYLIVMKYTVKPELTWLAVAAPIWGPVLCLIIIGVIIMAVELIKGIPEMPDHI